MENIKIRISSIVDGTPWLFTGEGTKKQQGDKTIIQAKEVCNGEEVLHHLVISQNKIKISRLATGATHLEFFPDKKGNLLLCTEYGDISGVITTKKFAIKKMQNTTHVTLSYNTDFDQHDAEVKKIQISYSEV